MQRGAESPNNDEGNQWDNIANLQHSSTAESLTSELADVMPSQQNPSRDESRRLSLPAATGGGGELLWLSPNYRDPSKLTFPQQMHRLLREHDSTNVVSWLPDGKAFVVLDQKSFTGHVLPQYFGKNIAYTSWTRRLRRWGWQNVAKSTYYNEHFHRDRPMQCLRMNYDRTPNRDLPDRAAHAEGFGSIGSSTRSLNSSITSLSMGSSTRSLSSSMKSLQPVSATSASSSQGRGAQGHQRRGGFAGRAPSPKRSSSARHFLSSSTEMIDLQRSLSLTGSSSGQHFSQVLENNEGTDPNSLSEPTLNFISRTGIRGQDTNTDASQLSAVQVSRNMTLQQLRQQQELLVRQQRMLEITMAQQAQSLGEQNLPSQRLSTQIPVNMPRSAGAMNQNLDFAQVWGRRERTFDLADDGLSSGSSDNLDQPLMQSLACGNESPPNAEERLVMQQLSSGVGRSASSRFRPEIQGSSDWGQLQNTSGLIQQHSQLFQEMPSHNSLQRSLQQQQQQQHSLVMQRMNSMNPPVGRLDSRTHRPRLDSMSEDNVLGSGHQFMVDPFGDGENVPKPESSEWDGIEGKEEHQSSALPRVPLPPSFLPRHNRRPGAA